MILLDTNVLSELMRPSPNQIVLSWVAAQSDQRLHTTSICVAEILQGVAIMPEGRRRTALRAAAEVMFQEDFSERIAVFDHAAAVCFANIIAARRRMGRPISHEDAQIAAIAQATDAALATRNVDDFVGLDLFIINPWRFHPG